MAYGFYAYIDEAGDQGFTFRDPPERASSQWFNLSAVVVRETSREAESREFIEFAKTVSKKHWSKLHFRELPHERRAALSHYLSRRPIQVSSVCWNKRELMEDDHPHTLDQRTRMYHYSIRFLLERISWLVRDARPRPESPICRLVFAKCKNLKYDVILNYLRRLRAGDEEEDIRIHWPSIDIENILVQPSSELAGLQIADIVASSVHKGFELDPHERTEATYVRHLRRRTYCRGTNYRAYGMKIMPRIPPVEPQYDDRYDWIAEYT